MKLLSNIVILLSILLFSCQTTKSNHPSCQSFDRAYIEYIEKIGFTKGQFEFSEDKTKMKRSASLVYKQKLIAISFEFFIPNESKPELDRLKKLNAAFAGQCSFKDGIFNVYYLTVIY